MMNIPRKGLSNQQWKQLKSLLPPEKPKSGRPNNPHKPVVEGILFILRTGCPWRDLPEKYGNWKTVYSRHYRWTRKGIWQKVLEMVLIFAQEAGVIDWNLHFVDGSVIRAHQHAAGARRKAPDGRERNAEEMALGRSRGGFSTKVHIRTDGQGRPLVIVLTPGQRHETQVFGQLLSGVRIKTTGPGRPSERPYKLVGDKGYNSKEIRSLLKKKGIGCVIPKNKRQKMNWYFDKESYKKRGTVECTFNRAKQNRRLATRYEKLPEMFLAMWTISSIVAWL